MHDSCDANAIIDNFNVPVNVIGLSAGGAITLQLAADHPHSVCRLVVAGAECP
jgi:pimeloyl-ACP methyl ester carboxylesterase